MVKVLTLVVVGILLISQCAAIKVKVRTGDWVWHDFNVNDTTTIIELKKIVHKETGQEVEGQRMISKISGNIELLNDDDTIGSIKATGSDILELQLKDNLKKPAGNLIFIQVPSKKSELVFQVTADMTIRKLKDLIESSENSKVESLEFHNNVITDDNLTLNDCKIYAGAKIKAKYM